MSEKKQMALNERLSCWCRHVLSWCDRVDDDEEQRPALHISGPTDFRREDISIPGLTQEQQEFIRQKARADAQKMYPHLQPLRSSPSEHFASPQHPTTLLPSYEDFTTPRSAPSPVSTRGKRSGSFGTKLDARLDRVKAHSRKISNSLSKPLSPLGGPLGPIGGYHAVGGSEVREDSKYEMRALMDPNSLTRNASPSTADAPSGGKMSGESYSFSDFEDRDSGKGLHVKF